MAVCKLARISEAWLRNGPPFLVAKMERDFELMTATQIAQMRGLAASFGLEPSARARLSVKPDEKTADPAAKYLAG